MGSSSPPPHALVIPYPAQGHVISFMELSHRLIDHGFHVTFVNTDFDHARVMASLPGPLSGTGPTPPLLRLVSIPDGLEPGADRNNLKRLTLSVEEHMPGLLEKLLVHAASGVSPVTCVIADHCMAWALDVAKKIGLRAAAFSTTSADALVMALSIPRMIDDGTIDANGKDGVPTEHRMIRLGPQMPPMNTAHFWWNCLGDASTNQVFFDYLRRGNKYIDTAAEWILCNSSSHVESPVFKYSPKVRPIGPMLPGLRPGRPVGRFWPEDSSCEDWLNQQPPKSVVYVSFGSFTIFDPRQFRGQLLVWRILGSRWSVQSYTWESIVQGLQEVEFELALGLEILGRRFLWVVRPDLTEKANMAFPGGFEERVAGRARIVGWLPQQRVLAHPSVVCFVSHCGWNSTMEGITNGLPFLCWPYFGDQFLNESYICNTWKVGLRLSKDVEGIVTKEEIKAKLEALLSNKEVVGRALELKEMAARSVGEGGSSFDNFNEFVESMMKVI
ncbi:UDP-glycosyltransferase 83A1 [Acorus calamus]|uniref:UDP-glycosyltransferase 83A1 n=1 Tax=Acorus calamus TaxID=4465 RepID=A0AAV9E2C4_ACOCL|nr:UDP-glycosyltransferase 83A1 [Acorus calamus]